MNISPQKVLVIDNDATELNCYRTYFENFEKYTLVGTFTNLIDVLKLDVKSAPDVIVSEIHLPYINGLEGLHYLKRTFPTTKFIITSTDKSTDAIRTAFREGAKGYLTKPISAERLCSAIASVCENGTAMSADVADTVVSMFKRKKYSSFTERENQIIEYLGQGATYKTIAETLFVTPSAVNFHIQNIYLKLNVNSKSEALAKLKVMELPSFAVA